MNIGIFEPAIGTANMGDYIIADSINRELLEIFPYDFKIFFPSHEKISLISYKKIVKMKFTFVGGSNLLSSNMNKRNQWKINLIDALFIKNAILFGVGWWQYQNKPNFYTKMLLKRVLKSDYIHSVRDSFTEKQLLSIGITNVINTACPTTWTLTENHCKLIPKKKSDSVVFTLTDYMKDKVYDNKLIEILEKNYNNIYFWIQGSEDLVYLKSISSNEKIKLIAPSLAEYDKVLMNSEGIDYIGTRLHAGIRALQKKVRTIIIAIDNRATEKSKDINLKIIQRNNIEEKLDSLINEEFETKIKLPLEKINKWKAQFIKSA